MMLLMLLLLKTVYASNTKWSTTSISSSFSVCSFFVHFYASTSYNRWWRHYVIRSPVQCLSIRYINRTWRNITFLSGGISTKPATNIHHVNLHCSTGLQSERSKVSVMTRAINLQWHKHMFWGVALMLTCSFCLSVSLSPLCPVLWTRDKPWNS